MKSKNKCVMCTIVPLLISCLILFGSKSTNAQEVEDEREFDYAQNGGKGPRKWGEIKKEWAACNNGTMQSPIDMSSDRVKIISKPEIRKYKVSNATLKNRGHDIQIQWSDDAGSIFINGTEYALRYAHWHSSSEHTVHGRRYDMELHLVHLSKDPNVNDVKIAVIGVLYKIGKPDQFLSKLMPSIMSITDKKHEIMLGMVDPNDIKTRSTRYYRYIGSLTIPPCTEGVIWTLNKKVRTVSKDQVKQLREAVHDYAQQNARPLQPHNSRDVYLYGPGVTN